MRYFIVAILCSLWLFGADAKLTIEKNADNRTKIALIDGSQGVTDSLGQKFFQILLADLKISGHFLADTTHHKGDFKSNLFPPSIGNKEYVLKYALSQQGGLSLVVSLVNVSSGSSVFQKSYNMNSQDKYPFLAHKAISDMNAALNFPDISWINRYLLFSRYSGAKQSEILLADYTLNYTKVIISGGLNLFPKWADSEQKSFYYTSFSGRVPTLYRLNIYTGAKESMATSEGMLVCSDVNSNGTKALLTMAPNGQPDIYELDVATKQTRRLTDFGGIDVGGRYVDDYSGILFVSNRLGYPNIFKKSLFGSGVTQVVHHGRNNNQVDAFGDKIVYASRDAKRSFNLYLASSSGSGAYPLTSSGENQFPRFSSNGKVVLFVKQQGQGSAIGYINLETKQSEHFSLGGKKVQSIDW